MAEITKYLNGMQTKTSRGNAFNKNSIRKILTNKRYIGYYIYKDIENKDSIPRIISDELFNLVQLKIGKNKKAPARAKAKTDYLLTTKLICGLCEKMMVGVSGTGRSGKLYTYYSCNTNNQKECRRKNISKDYIENLVVLETKKLLTKEKIDIIAKEIVALCKKESNTPTIQHLKRLIKENEKATKNLIKALEQGKAADIITDSIMKKKAELIELEKQLAQESIRYPVLTVTQVKFFMKQFKNGNANDMKYRKSLVDTFVRKMTLYEDKMTILYNVQDSQSSIPLESNGSYKGTMAF